MGNGKAGACLFRYGWFDTREQGLGVSVRYTVECVLVLRRIILHCPLNSDGVILQHFVRTPQHESEHHG